MQIELDTKYRPGKRTFMYLFITRGWILIAASIALAYLAFEMYFGRMRDATAQFLANHPEWYTDVSMLSEWLALGALAFLFIAYLRASVLYRAYSFHVDEHALHLRRGLIRVQEITIPYHQISHIHIEQPYHWRFLGLSQLDITISSSRTSLSKIRKQRDFLLPCVDTSLARALSHFLTHEVADEDDVDDELDEEEDGEDILVGAGM